MHLWEVYSWGVIYIFSEIIVSVGFIGAIASIVSFVLYLHDRKKK